MKKKYRLIYLEKKRLEKKEEYDFDFLEDLLEFEPMNDVPFESREGNDVINTIKITLNQCNQIDKHGCKMVVFCDNNKEIKYGIIEFE